MFTKMFYTFKDQIGSNYQLVINGIEIAIVKQTINSRTLIYYSQTIDFVYENLEDYNPTKNKMWH